MLGSRIMNMTNELYGTHLSCNVGLRFLLRNNLCLMLGGSRSKPMIYVYMSVSKCMFLNEFKHELFWCTFLPL